MQNLVPVTHDASALHNLEYLRVTSMQTFEKCPYTWAMQYLVSGPVRIQSKYAAIGTAAHTLCEMQINHIFKGRPIDQKVKRECLALMPTKEELDNIVNYLNMFTEMDVKHLATEIRLHQRFHPDAPNLSGQMDFVFEDSEGCLVIMDHKTHRQFQPASYWENRLQQLCYAWMSRKQWPEYKRVKFRIGYPNHGTYVEWETYAEDDVLLLRRLTKLWNEMTEYNRINQWPQTLNDECGYCPCRTICPANIQSIQNFKDAFVRSVGTKTTAEKLQYVKNVIKSAEQLEADLTSKLSKEIEEAGGELRTAEGTWLLASSNRRSAKFSDTWNTIFNFATQTPGASEWLRDNAEELFSVKVGGLDKLTKAFDINLSNVVTTAQSAPSPTFKVETSIARALRATKKGITDDVV